MLLQLDFTRFITIYIAQGIGFAVFVYIAWKVLKRDRKRLNLIFASFFISSAAGLFVNFIYAPLTNPNVVLIMNYLTNFGILFSLVFLLVFDLILLRSEKIITPKRQNMIIIGYGIICLVLVVFLYIPGWGVQIGTSTDWKPVWSLPFYLYVMIVMTCLVFVPTVYLSYKIYTQFQDAILKKKWKYYFLGMVLLYFFVYGVFTSNFLNISLIRTLIGAIGLILALIGTNLMYYGVGRQIRKEENVIAN